MLQPKRKNETLPSDEEISMALTRYNFMVKVFDKVIQRIKIENRGIKHWFVFAEHIGTKFLTQAFTLQQIFTYQMFLAEGNTEYRIVDVSSIYSLLRVQLETYAVFFHLFVDDCEMEEKIIRFRLWELDGLKSLQKYSVTTDVEIEIRRKQRSMHIEECIAAIYELPYFNNLSKSDQEYLIKYSVWRFNADSLRNSDKNKRRLSIDQMIMNTGLKSSHFDDTYAFTSTHSHTTYWSVVQNDSLTDEERLIMEHVGMMQAIFVTAFFIKDFGKIFQAGKDVFNSLTENEQAVINSFDKRGRD